MGPIPGAADGTGWWFLEFSRRSGDFAIVGVATTVCLDIASKISEAQLAFSGVDTVPVRTHSADSMLIGPATEADLAETVRLVEALGRRIVATKADVRSYEALKVAMDDGVEQFGRLDIVCANAGISTEMERVEELSEEIWLDMIDVNLNGVWRRVR